jgi:formyl-CoA transferase
MWPVVARGKKSLILDLRVHGDRDVLRSLIPAVDVLVENVPQRVLQLWGLSHDDLLALNPDLVVVSVSCFGATGPAADLPGSGTLAEAFGGLTHLTGDRDGPPVLASIALGDGVAAMSAVIGVLLACRAREQLGSRGQVVDVAMYEPILQLVGQALAGWSPGEEAPMRAGSRLANPVSVRNLYRSNDARFVAISCSTPRHQRELLQLAGLSVSDPTADDMDAATERWVAGQPAAAALDALHARRVPGVLVNDLADLVDDQQAVARASFQKLPNGRMAVSPTPVLTRSAARPVSLGPELGEHSAEVLAWADRRAAAGTRAAASA